MNLNPLNQVFYLNFAVNGKWTFNSNSTDLNPLNQVFYLNVRIASQILLKNSDLNPLNQVFYLNSF